VSIEVTDVMKERRQIVVFELANESYGVDIHQVREIIRMTAITKVPKAPGFVKGVINLRGSIIPVIDLRKRFDLEDVEDSNERRIVVIEIEGTITGMIVDAVSEVLRVDEELIEPPSPYIFNIETQFISGIAKIDDRLVILLNVNEVLSENEKEQLKEVESELETDE
jgi:purine-binding chemotaxis protein CheW